MWKIIGQIDGFDCFLTTFITTLKYPKKTVLKKWKFIQKRKKIKDWKTYFKYHI